MSPMLPQWLPESADLAAAFTTIKEASSPAARLKAIIALAQHRLDFIQIGKLDRYLARTLAELPDPEIPIVRLAWLASATVEHLLPAVRIACLRSGLLVENYLAPYGQYRQELFDDSSGLARFQPHVMLLCLDPEHERVEVPIDASRSAVDEVIERRVAEIRQVWQMAIAKLSCAVIHETVPDLSPSLFGSFDRLVPGSPAAVSERLDAALVAAALEDRVSLLDLRTFSTKLGHDAWYDRVRWHQAKQLVAPPMAPLYGELVARLVSAIRGRSRKCLVLDLDNTLWGGVVGDDGIDRLVLGPGTAAGEAFAAFQRHVRRLRDRGVILAVCSKNDKVNAEAVFTNHPEMTLRLDDIAAFVANWKDKATNLKQIADELSLGLDALVFFDDNPAERALVRAELPMVAVPEVPDDPAYFASTLADAGYFDIVSVTTEDLSRAQQYQDNRRRQTALQTATDMTSFLASLAMQLQCGVVDASSVPRVTQLINKTNQFNVTTRRYTEPELAAFATNENNLALHFRLVDRFGDNGLIAVLLVRFEAASEQLVIDTLLMSCRVLGRGVELAMANLLVEHGAARGISTITGTYVPTAKNAMVADLFSRLGFTQLESVSPDASTRWALRVADFRPHTHLLSIGEST